MPRGPRVEPLGGFDVDARAGLQRARQQRERAHSEVGCERWIDEGQVETIGRALEVVERIALDDFGLGAEVARGIAQLPRHRALALDHHDARRAARQRLESERAAAGEEVEAREAVEALAEPVEERLADA